MMMPVLLFVVGLGAGGLGVLLGVGGGVILVPALVLLTHLPFTAAVGTSLLCVVATSVAGSAVQFARGAVDATMAVRLQSLAVVGAVGAGLVAPAVPVGILNVAFGVLLVIAAWRIWPRVTHPDDGARRPHPALADVGAGAGGVVASLLGVGGGIIFTPLLHLVVGMDFYRSAATSVYLIGVTAASGGLVYLARGDVMMDYVGPTMLGVLVGATVAARGVRYFSVAWLKRGFTILLLYVAARMLLRGMSGA
jgi:uncharacterized membrane protein YfcA